MPPKAKPGPYGIQPAKSLLRAAGITHAQAAESLAVSTQWVTMLVNGQTRPSLTKAAQLARLLGAPIEACFTSAMLGVKPARKRPAKR